MQDQRLLNLQEWVAVVTGASGGFGRGAKVLSELVPTPWGHLNQRLRTADDMQLTLFQRT